ncbi:MAG: hypothetical protein ACP5O2_01490 [Bacteroidales bacterium]
MRYQRFLLVLALPMLWACQPSRQMQQAVTHEVYYAPIRSKTHELTQEEKQKVDELVTRKIKLQGEIDRLTEASDSGNQADAGQLENLQQQRQQLDAEIKDYLVTPARQAYFDQLWLVYQK